ncbi:hypothetical protein ACFXJ8_17855 [Nonomuraea sp. NPDC059194]|uniref:hypothetical protein n=1 Tax=Nonomuraea sp. NPDC059194 TaxID=3346764 RepID=UPI003694FD88
MKHAIKLNERQLGVLRRIADGEITSRQMPFLTTIDALRSRGLIKIGSARQQEKLTITNSGRFYLEHGHYADGAEPRRPRPRTADLVLAQIRALKEVEGVSPKQTRRAIRILLAVTREAVRRGHSVSLYRGGQIELHIRQGGVTVSVTEKFARVPRELTAKEKQWIEQAKAEPHRLLPKPRTWERGPTGMLTLDVVERPRMSSYSGDWSDERGWRPENHIEEILAYAESRAAAQEARYEAEARAMEQRRHKDELDREEAIKQFVQARRASACGSKWTTGAMRQTFAPIATS